MYAHENMHVSANIIRAIKLNLKQTMLKKLNISANWTYCSVPHGKNLEKQKQEMRKFIEEKLDHFLLWCFDCFKILTIQDRDSIGTLSLTPNAKILYRLLNYLVENGFPGPNDFGKPINFWSGNVARKKASENENEISDSRIPAISALFDVCQAVKEIQGFYDDHMHLIESCILRLFASHAKGIASVYISSDKISESAGFTIPNFFWTDELLVLRELKNREIVQDIQVHLYDHEKKQWKNAVSLLSFASYHIPMRMRSLHPLDPPDTADRFKKLHMSEQAKIAWKSSKPRPEISFGRMQEIARTWCKKAEAKQMASLQEKSNKLIKLYKQDIARELRNFYADSHFSIGFGAQIQIKNPTITTDIIQAFKKDTYYLQTKEKLEALESIKKCDSIQKANIIFQKNRDIFAIERDKYKTRLLRGIAFALSFGASYGLSDARNLHHYFTRTHSSVELENILKPVSSKHRNSV